MSKSLKQSLGIDVSKESLALSLGTLTSGLDKEFKAHADVSNDPKGYKVIRHWLQQHTDSSGSLTIVMEATGVYHQGIAHYLHDKGYKVSVMQSGRVKRYAQSLDQRSKTDALDSKMLSMLGLERSLRQWQPPSQELQLLKGLSRERYNLLKSKSIENNRFEAMRSSSYQNTSFTKRYKRRIKLITEQIAAIEEDMKALVQESAQLPEKVKHLESIPGVSFIAAATVIGETLGFMDINNAKQITSYAGYDVVQRESGTFKGKTKISKRGNAHIRGVLHMPSMTCVRCNPTLKPFYERLKPNKEKPIVALIAVQRKLLILMYTLWRNNTDYDPAYETKKQQKLGALAAQDNETASCVIS